MKEIATWGELFYGSIKALSTKIMDTIPMVFGGVLMLLIGWLFAKVVSFVFTRLLTALQFDKLANQVKADDLLKKANITMTPSQLIGKFIYWLFILLVIITISDTMGWESISKEISNLLRFLPKLLVAIIFFVVGTYVATFIRDIIKGATSSIGISTGKMISSFVFYFLLIMVILTALNQAGMDTSIITSNLLLILGAILAAAAISYGLASRDVLTNILASFFSRKTFGIGQVIEVDGRKGEIVSMSNISITIKDENGNNVVIPTQKLINNNVVIFKSGEQPHAGK